MLQWENPESKNLMLSRSSKMWTPNLQVEAGSIQRSERDTVSPAKNNSITFRDLRITTRIGPRLNVERVRIRLQQKRISRSIGEGDPLLEKSSHLGFLAETAVSLFEDACKLIMESTVIEDEDLIRTLLSIACAKVHLLLQVLKGKEVEDDHTFELNDQFTAPFHRIKASESYVLNDIVRIFWFYPSLGGMEYVIHHLLATISETTTSSVNLRWYLENAGMKNSRSYIKNGVVMFVSWLVAARIVLFVYLFYHISAAHYDQAARIVLSVYLFYHISAAHYDQVFLNKLHLLPNSKSKVTTLHGASGIVKPGRMTLLHGPGPPSLGKTTLLLAGKLDNDLNVSGKVTYNGHEMKEFVPETTSAYISQYDLHMGMGELTVRETLAFSAQVQGVGARYEMLKELSRKEKEANIKPDPDIDIYMKAARIVLFMYLFYHIMISRLLFCCVIMESKCTYVFSRCAEKVPLL